jgi:hypothetical protein
MTIHKKRAAALLIALFAVSFALLPGAVSAVEVPAETTQVSIPVTISASAPIAGGEIEFSSSGGLTYTGFAPATGLENKIETAKGGKNYIGFFSAENKYVPVEGHITLGRLIFTYGGDNPESISFSEIRLHTRNGSEVREQSVDSKIIKPNTLVNITRAASNAGGENGSGNGGAGGGPSTGVGRGNASVNLPESDSEEANVIDLDLEAVEAGESDLEAVSSNDAIIGSGDGTPLAQQGEKSSGIAGAFGWWIYALAGAVALTGFSIFIVHYRRRKKEQK